MVWSLLKVFFLPLRASVDGRAVGSQKASEGGSKEIFRISAQDS